MGAGKWGWRPSAGAHMRTRAHACPERDIEREILRGREREEAGRAWGRGGEMEGEAGPPPAR